jgi:hypothetical protein
MMFHIILLFAFCPGPGDGIYEVLEKNHHVADLHLFQKHNYPLKNMDSTTAATLSF